MSPGLRFCAGCGANADKAIPAAPAIGGAPPVEEPIICKSCGVALPPRAHGCPSCQAQATPPPLRAHRQPNGGFWVAVQASFTCNACRFDSPLNHFELGEGVLCTHCGLEQRYELDRWRELTTLAHVAGDFGSGSPEGRFPDPEVRLTFNPYTAASRHGPWMQEGPCRAAPGNPLCRSCRAPVVVAGTTAERLDVVCTGCGERRTYERPETARRLKHVAGVLADEHEEGGQEVTLEQGEGGVVVLRCPSCSAPLQDIRDADGVVTCSYCRVSCRISTRTHARAGHKGTPTKTWWLYFDQPSSQRKKQLNQARQVAARAEKNRRMAEQRARSQQGQQQQRPQRAAATSPEAIAKQSERRAILSLVLFFVAAPIVGVIIYFQNNPMGAQQSAQSEAGVDESVLERFSFTMPPSEAGKLFGVDGSSDMNFQLRQPGVFQRGRITRGLGPSYGIDLYGGEKIDLNAALERLKQLAPNRLKKDPHSYEISTAKSLLRFNPSPTPQYRGRIEVMTWVKDDERAKTLADAFLAAARYAAYGDKHPSSEQLRMLNGPLLSEVAKLDLGVAIEAASKTFTTLFPDGTCETRTDLVSSKSQLVCTLEVDHLFVDKVAFGWKNEAKAHIESAVFVFRDPKTFAPAASGCLDTALGEGEDIVVDHATGDTKRSWKLDPRGDLATTEGFGIGIAIPESAQPTAPPPWAKRFDAIVHALSSCSR